MFWIPSGWYTGRGADGAATAMLVFVALVSSPIPTADTADFLLGLGSLLERLDIEWRSEENRAEIGRPS